MSFPAATSRLAVAALDPALPGRAEPAHAAAAAATTPTSNQRIVAAGDALRHRGIDVYG